MHALRKFFDFQTLRDTAALVFLGCFIVAYREHDWVLFGIGFFSFIVTIYIQYRWDYREYVYGEAIFASEARIDLENTLERKKRCGMSGSGS